MANGMLNKDERRAIVSTADELYPKLSETQLGAIRRDMVYALGAVWLTDPYVQLSDYADAAMSLRLKQVEKHLTLRTGCRYGSVYFIDEEPHCPICDMQIDGPSCDMCDEG